MKTTLDFGLLNEKNVAPITVQRFFMVQKGALCLLRVDILSWLGSDAQTYQETTNSIYGQSEVSVG